MLELDFDPRSVNGRLLLGCVQGRFAGTEAASSPTSLQHGLREGAGSSGPSSQFLLRCRVESSVSLAGFLGQRRSYCIKALWGVNFSSKRVMLGVDPKEHEVCVLALGQAITYPSATASSVQWNWAIMGINETVLSTF